MNERVQKDMDTLHDIGVFLKQDRNGDHLSESDIEKTKEAVAFLQSRLARYERKDDDRSE